MSSYVITGCSRGLGAALVAQLANRPACSASTIFATMRRDNTDHLKQLAAQWLGRVVPVKLEATDDESVANAAKVVEEKLQGKGLDYLINNAGVSSYCPDGLGGVKDFTDVFNVNVSATHRVTQAFLPLVRRGKQKTVVNVSTTQGSIQLSEAHKYTPSYSYKVSKAALNMLTRLYAHEYSDVIFLAASPGWLKTKLGGGDMADLSVQVGAEKLLEIVDGASLEKSGKFFNVRVPGWEDNEDVGHRYDGKEIPW